MADRASDPDVRREFRSLARRFEELAERIEAKYRERGIEPGQPADAGPIGRK